MKTKLYFIVLLILSSSLYAQKNYNDFSICGTIDEVPTEITPISPFGGFINCATDDGSGNVFIPQGTLVNNAHLNGTVEITYSVTVVDEAMSIDYNTGRLVCSTMGDYVTTFLTGSESATVQNFRYALSGGNGIDRVGLEGGYLFISELNSNYAPSIIHILDWTTGPNLIEPIGKYNPANSAFRDWVIYEDRIYIVGKFNNVDKLVVVNIANKNNPVETGSVAIENATCIGVDDSYIYVGCKSGSGNDGLKVLLRNDNPVIDQNLFLAQIDFDQIYIQDNKLYARDGKNLIVIDISHQITAVDPQVLGQATFNDLGNYKIGGVVGNILYYTDSGQFGMIDISSFTSMVFAGVYVSPRIVFDFEMDDSRMIIVGDGIYSYDIADPANPELKSFGKSDGAQKVFMYMDQCFVTNNTAGLQIYDVDNLTASVGHYVSTSAAQHDFVDMAFNAAACFAVGEKNLEIFSRTEDEYRGGAYPRKAIARFDLGGEASSVWLDGYKLFVAHTAGISIFNVFETANITFMNTVEGPLNPTSMGMDGDYLIVCSVEGNSTYLSAYNASTDSPTLLKKTKIADGIPATYDQGRVMDLIDGLILVIVENEILSFVYLPGTNEFAIGPTCSDINEFYNIKGLKLPEQYKSSIRGSLASTAIARYVAASQASNGMKSYKIIGTTKVFLTNGFLQIYSSGDQNIVVGCNAEGYVTVNGEPVVDESGNKIKAKDVTKLSVYDGGPGANKIDLQDVDLVNFPKLPVCHGDDPATVTDESEKNIQVFCGGGKEEVIVSEKGAYIIGGGGDDYIQSSIEQTWLEYYDDPYGPRFKEQNEIQSVSIDVVSVSDNFKINCGSGNDHIIVTPTSAAKKLTGYSVSEIIKPVFKNEFPNTLEDDDGIDTLDFGQNPMNRRINLDLQGAAQTIDETGWRVYLNGQFEVYIGGDGVDVVIVKPLSDAARFIDGGGSKSVDTLYFDTDGLDAVDDGSAIYIEGFKPLAYANFSKVILGDVIVNVEEHAVLPTEHKLFQNYPNPFNPSTRIEYQLPGGGRISLMVYDILGREIKTLVNEEQKPGYYSVDFNSAGLASGIYFYRIKTKDFSDVKKMIIIK